MNRQKNVAEIKRLLQEKREVFPRLVRFLVSKGVLPELAEVITIEYMRSAQEMGALPKILSSYIRTCGEIVGGCVALVGPTGVGKSTTILKLAAHFQRKGKRVGILCLDPAKFEQMKGVDVELFCGLDAYEPGCDLTLVDTEGCNYYQETRVDALGEILAELPEVDIHLTLAASTKEVDLYGAIHQFSALQPKSLIFTKLDETLTLGTLLNICEKSRLPIRYITHGYPLPGELEVASGALIVRKMLADLNTEEFQQLRYITVAKKISL